MPKKIQLTTLATLLTLAIGNSVEAASITWSNGQNFGGSNGFQAIDTTGSLVEAINVGSTQPLTVDPSGLNITFTAAKKFNQFIFNSGSPDSTDTAWNTIINQTDWNRFNTTFDEFLTGLTVGKQYQIQLFASDTRPCCSERTQYFDDGLGNQSSTFVQDSFTSIIGKFTADAPTQSLGIWTSSNAPILNAYVLRDITPTGNDTSVPEPTSLFGLLALGALGSTYLKRKQKQEE